MEVTEDANVNEIVNRTVSERQTTLLQSPYATRCMGEGESVCAHLRMDG